MYSRPCVIPPAKRALGVEQKLQNWPTFVDDIWEGAGLKLRWQEGWCGEETKDNQPQHRTVSPARQSVSPSLGE